MKLTWFKASAAILALFCGTAFAANTAVPGTLNYVEGQASIGNQALSSKSVGATELQPGQVLSTDNGKAEVLLTPGVFLRLDDNTVAKMISPSLTNTQIGLEKGRAMIEVDEIHRGNDLQVKQGDATTRLMKTGLYQFDANTDKVAVYKGEAQVLDNDKKVKVKGGHELALNDPSLKTHKFDKDEFKQDELYKWSNLRSSYLAEANADQARYVVNNWYGNPGWFGSGWYWNPYFAAYTFIPGGGMFYNPFGWGYYSPLYVYSAPYYGYRPAVTGNRGTAVTVPRPVAPRGAATRVPSSPRVAAPRPSAIRPAAPSPRMGGFGGGFHGGAVHGSGSPAHR